VFKAIHEKSTVRKAGHRIVERSTQEIVLQSFTVRDVLEVERDCAAVCIFAQVDTTAFETALGVVRAQHPKLNGRRETTRSSGPPHDAIDHPLGVLRREVIQKIGPDEPLHSPTQHALDCGVDVSHGEVRLQHYDDFRAVLDQPAKPAFTSARPCPGTTSGSPFVVWSIHL
jgi:hypothetical protein